MNKIFFLLTAFILQFSTIQIYAQSNDCASAIVCEINGTPVAGVMVPPVSWWYTFTLYADYTNVEISTCNSTINMSNVYLYEDCSGTFIASGDDCNPGSSNYNETITLTELNAGTYYVEVVGDFGYPSGAYSLSITGETSALNNDIGITQISNPVKNFNNAMPVTVTIENFGVNTQSNFPVSYTFMGNTVTETYTGTLMPGESAEYTFNQTIDMSVGNTYSLTAQTVLPLDENSANDPIAVDINTHVNPNALFFIDNDYAAVPDNPAFDFTNDFTIETWFYVDPTMTTGKVISKHTNTGVRSGYSIEYDGSNIKAVIGIGGSWATVSAPVNAGEWNHVALVYHAGISAMVQMFLNGVSQGTANGTIQTNSVDLYIGGSHTYGDYWTGYIDELRIWNDARTEAEILDNMHTEIEPHSENLLAYYDFNRGIPEGDNTAIGTLPDMTNNNFHADMYNFALQAGLADGNFFEDCNLDLTAPVPDLAELVDITAECEIASLTAPTATDNCNGEITATHNVTLPLTSSTTITWTYEDAAGNTSTQTQEVVIEDVTTPTITCIENQTINLNEGETFYTVQGEEFDPAEASDNCEVASIVNDFNNTATLAGAELPEGTTTIVWTVTDNAGNESSCSFDVTVGTILGIDDLAENGISVYPNPTDGFISIECIENNVQKIVISDITGKQIVEINKIQQNMSVDLSNIENGIYIINMLTGKKTLSTKIVKK